ncbi:heparinase II/III domain-containing protein [Kribbella shirazensis]|uniref:Heparinase II/III-like C-terminal domain-containing protein n=1 Tax=Kribbella shirazensis TaxID=1105143 RepID=A0A7X5VIX4_9ACTN|nr:heparinase II/III family protein [Kribbella shirazensis]NIK61666.1 hypothetical protein [Kribbella shirazensis]
MPIDLRRQGVGGAAALLGVPDLRDRVAWEALDRDTVDDVLTAAEVDRAQPWPQTLLSDYARYWRDGVRVAYEGPAGELRRRTSTAVLAAAMTGEHVDEAADGLLLLCEQTTWCWAAHESFAAARGEVVADPDDPYVDLGAAETVQVLAWADLVLGSALDERVPGLRRRLRREARIRVFEPFLGNREWHWLGLDGRLHNWSPWIQGHILSAALLLESDPDTQFLLVESAVDGLSRYLDAMPADGGCDEGYAYWWNGPARLVEALELLDRITGGALDPWKCEPLAELAQYPRRMALGDGWYVNVGDGPARPNPQQPWHVLHRWGRRVGDPGVTAFAAAHRGQPQSPEVGLGRALIGLFDREWWTAAAEPLDLPRSTWLPDTELLVARDAPAGLALAVKGGHNDENHNHNDVGSFIAAVDSAPVLVDLGQPTYTAISFSPRRYQQWVMQSAWHNVPLIDGHEQSPGAAERAGGLQPQEDQLALTLPGGVVRRTASLDRDARAIRVTDEWQDGHQIVEHFILAGTPQRHRPGGLVVRSLSGVLVALSWDDELGPGTLERRAVDDELLEAVWGPDVHRLVIDASGRTSFELTVSRFEETL